jgi:hypothetical protein
MTSTESRKTTTQQQPHESENEALLTLELEYVKPSLPPPVGLDYRQCLEESPASVDHHNTQTSDAEGQQQQEEREILGNQSSSDLHPTASVAVAERNRRHCRLTVLLTLATVLPIASLLVSTLFVSTHVSCHHKDQREHGGNQPLDVVHSPPPHHTLSNTTISSRVSTTTAPTLQASWTVVIVPHHKQQEDYYKNYSGREVKDQQQEEEDGAE